MSLSQGTEAENKLKVSLRHREEWRQFRENLLMPPIEDKDEAGAKRAKAFADSLRIYQEGERRAWGFAEGEIDTNLEVAWEQDN